MTTASKGRLFALVLLLVAGVVIGVAVFSNKAAPRTASAMDPAYDAPPPAAPGEDATVVRNPGSLQDVIAGGAKGTWTTTREDGSVAMRILSERLDPKPEGRFELSALTAWFYNNSNRLRVLASRADLLWPSQDKTPESGTLAAIEFAMFAAATPETPDDNPGISLFTATLDSIAFDAAMSQAQSKDVLEAKGDGFALVANGFLVRLNEVTRQVTYLRVDASPKNRLTIGGERAKRGDQGAESPAKNDTPTQNKPAPTDPQIDHYALSLGGPVQIRQGERILTGERVTILFRLVDGALRESAIANIEMPDGDRKSRRVGRGSGSGSSGDETLLESSALTDITWAGPAELTLVENPVELASDDVYLRLEATEREAVSFADAEMDLAMRAGRAEYFATTGRVVLDAQGPIPAVSFKTGDGLTLDARKISLELAGLPNAIKGTAVGPARASAVDPEKPDVDASTISWDVEAAFALRPVGETFAPTSLALKGNVKASGPDGTATAETLEATFAEAAETNLGHLTSLTLAGNASLLGADSSRVAADRITVNFKPSDDRPVPTFAAAEGRINGETADGELRSAGKLTVTLTQDDKGRTRAQLFDASQDVVVRSRALAGKDAKADDYVELHGDSLTGDLETQIIDVSGAPATIARVDNRDRGSVTGATMRIEGESRRLTVFGPGSASRTLEHKKAAVDRLGVRWNTGMTYSDQSGEAECRGGVEAVGEFSGTDRHVVTGDTLTLRITPGSEDSATRELLAAIVSGSAFNPKSSDHARAEARRFVGSSLASGAPRLEALLSIESQSLAVRPVERSVEAPGPGRIVIEDRRSTNQSTPAGTSDVLVLGASSTTSTATSSLSTRGTTIFTWQGGVHVDGPSNTATMHSGVRVRHKPSGVRDIVDMECEKLEATFEAGVSEDEAPRPREIIASGAIFVRRGDLQLVGDRVRFLVGTNELVIEAEPGNTVSIDDAGRGTKATAEAVRLDTKTGAWTEIRRGSVTLPR